MFFSCVSSDQPLPAPEAFGLLSAPRRLTHNRGGLFQSASMKRIYLHNTRRFALVDDSDFDWLSHFRWNEFKLNRNLETSYAYTPLCGHTILMHKMILVSAKQIDHKDCNGLNNQRTNLRPYSGAQNQANSRKRRGTSSKYKGVCWHKPTRRWRAGISCDCKHYHLGTFRDEKLAAQAYDAAAIRMFRQFARVNFPNTAYARGEKGQK